MCGVFIVVVDFLSILLFSFLFKNLFYFNFFMTFYPLYALYQFHPSPILLCSPLWVLYFSFFVQSLHSQHSQPPELSACSLSVSLSKYCYNGFTKLSFISVHIWSFWWHFLYNHNLLKKKLQNISLSSQEITFELNPRKSTWFLGKKKNLRNFNFHTNLRNFISIKHCILYTFIYSISL